MAESPGPDLERVVELRRAALERSGYGSEAAAEIARRLVIDLEQAVSLTKHGFPPDVAFVMLRSGRRPVF
jgi:hypothetical protein